MNVGKFFSLLLLVTATSFSTLFSEESASRATIRLIDTIAVRGTTVELGEIARIESGDPLLTSQLSKVEITRCPPIGRSKLITSLTVEKALKRDNFEKRSKVLGSECSITTEARIIDEEEVKALIERWVATKVAPSVEAKIQYLRLPFNWKVPIGDEIDLAIETTNRNLGGQTNLSLRSKEGETILSTARAKVEIALYRDSLVVIRPIARKEKISAGDVEIHRADVTRAKGLEITDPTRVIGMEAKKDLKLGALITVRDIETPIAIKRGSSTKILVNKGSIRMSVAGAIAMQNGKEGETILFSNPMNRQEPLRAVVVREGVAKISIQ